MLNQISIPVLNSNDVVGHLPRMNTQKILREMFKALAENKATQPPQTLTLFPANEGDFISYLGVMANEKVFGVKVSPYIPTSGKPVVTAWSLLMSMETGQPLMLCDAGLLTVERTAATTALAVDALARENADVLTVIGLGALGQAHIKHVLGLRAWKEIRLFAADLHQQPEHVRQHLRGIDQRIQLCDSMQVATQNADVVMLCTSSASPVIQPQHMDKPCLFTSISTNAARAHEVPPETLSEMDVYCDYRKTTPTSAGEMQIATEQYGWSQDKIKGDLPEMMSGTCALPDFKRHVFFRSIGLGLEDVAIANELYKISRGG